jgi:hypothetical protein
VISDKSEDLSLLLPTLGQPAEVIPAQSTQDPTSVTQSRARHLRAT